MINYKYLIILLLGSYLITNAQTKSCDTPKDDFFEDLASITKCSVKPSNTKSEKGKSSSQVTVRVSVKRPRFSRKSQIKKQLRKKSIVSATGLNASSTHSSVASKSIALKNKLVSMTNVLSSEEIKKAKKFIELDKIPTFTKCKDLIKGKRQDCFNQELISHINKYFYYPSEAVQNNIQGKIWVRFIIDKNGNIRNIKTLGNSNTQSLKEVATFVVSKLPNFVPGTQGGRAVSSKYGFPIDFSLEQE